MSRYFSLILISFLFLACAKHTKQEQVISTNSAMVDLNEAKNDTNFILLDALMNQYYELDTKKSLKIFKDFYDKRKSLPFLLRALTLSYELDDENTTSALLEDGTKRFPSNHKIKRFQVGYFLHVKEYKKAQKIAEELLKKEKSSKNYELLGVAYYMQDEYKKALRCYKKAYEKNSNENNLLKLVGLYDEKLKKSKDAIRYLSSHIKMKKASKNVYMRLLAIYGKSLNIKGLIDTYRLLYKDFKEDEYADKVIQLYMYNKNKNGVIDFLEQSGYDQDMLMDMYAERSEFKKAYKVAKKAYENSDNVDDLARVAMYEYESNKKNITKKVLKSICKKFDIVIEKSPLSLYLNYYGYVLIDHDYEVDKGIKYVKMALEKEPESVFYLDSLAWGHFKKKECKKALEIMEEIKDKSSEEEIKKHYKIIKKCVKNAK